jgi:hypothetical protein
MTLAVALVASWARNLAARLTPACNFPLCSSGASLLPLDDDVLLPADYTLIATMVRQLAYRSSAWLLSFPFSPLFQDSPLSPGARAPSRSMSAPCNHISHFDPPFIATVVGRHVHWMATAGLFANRFVGGWLRAVQAFPVGSLPPDRSSVKTALARLQAGHMVGRVSRGRNFAMARRACLGGAELIPGTGCAFGNGGSTRNCPA